MTEFTISVVDGMRVKGKPPNWFPSAARLSEDAGVPMKIAERWRRERYKMTIGLRRRVRQDRN